MTAILGPKYPGERITLGLDFSDRIGSRSVVSASSVCTVAIGTDTTPGDFLDGNPGFSMAPHITQPVRGGIAGNTYWVHTTLVLSDGDVITGSVKVSVVAQK